MTAAPPVMSMPEPRRGRSGMRLGVALVVVVAIVVALGVSQGWFGGSGAGAGASPSSSVEGVVPADSGVVAEGRAVPVSWAEVTAAGSGRVTAIPVKAGDTVAAGDVLVQLDDEAAGLDVDSATAAHDAAKAATRRAQAGVDQAQAGVDQAQAGVDQARGGVDQAQAARRAASAALAAAQAGLRAADAARDALPGTATKAQRRQADAEVSRAAAGVSQAAAGVSQAAAAVDAARAQLAAARAAVRSANAALDAAQADEGRARIAVSGAELGRRNLAITSPIAGTVIAVEPAVGEQVGPASGIVARVADTSAWRFETSDLSETSIARVREGAAATITVDGLPGQEIAGTVESVGGYGTPVQGDITFRVVVAPSGAVPDGLRWNMTVTIQIDGIGAG